MSHKHSSLLNAIFHNPVSGNIHWREIESLLHHLDATIKPAHGARFHVRSMNSSVFCTTPIRVMCVIRI